MKKNWITKLALGVAVAAMIFSIVTLVRAIVLGNGVFMACILTVGTAVIVAICAIMLYVLRNYDAQEDGDEDDEDDEEDNDEDEDASEEAEGSPAEVDADAVEQEVDSLIASLEKDSEYNLQNFEE